MGRQYRHLTLAEREDIMVHWKNRVGVSEIARLVGRDKSTVSREIRRNGWYSPVAGRMWCYRASTAHDKSQRRARRCRRQPLLANPRRLELVARLIRDRHRPPRVRIEGRIMIERPDLGVSDTTILQGGPQRPAGPHSRRAQEDERPLAATGGAAGRAVSTGGAGPVTHELGERPAIADRRERVGEGEGDTVAGRMSGAVLVTPARPGHQVVPGGRQGPLQTRGRRLTAQSSRPWPPTPPPPHRGPGPRVRPRVPPFKNHWAPPSTSARPAAPGSAAPMRTPTACCARCSPKRTPLDGTNPTRTQQVHNQLNQRPRKRLGWKTPEEAHTHRTLHFL